LYVHGFPPEAAAELAAFDVVEPVLVVLLLELPHAARTTTAAAAAALTARLRRSRLID
jgi:hypothetical protein